ncbi:MAG: TlpA family protein disulfide reductase, partial [Candidatus Cryptobacteroides sp.]
MVPFSIILVVEFCGTIYKMAKEAVAAVGEYYAGRGLKVVSIYAESDTNRWTSYADSLPKMWLNLTSADSKGQLREKYDLFGLPQIYLLDNQKRVIAKNIPADQLVFSIFEILSNR